MPASSRLTTNTLPSILAPYVSEHWHQLGGAIPPVLESPMDPTPQSTACQWISCVAATAAAARRGFPKTASRLGRGRPLEYRRILLQLCLARCVSLAELRVKIAPHRGHTPFVLAPDLSLTCLTKLLLDENSRPLHPWSQQRCFPLRSIDRSSPLGFPRKSDTPVFNLSRAFGYGSTDARFPDMCCIDVIGASSPLIRFRVVSVSSIQKRLFHINVS